MTESSTPIIHCPEARVPRRLEKLLLPPSRFYLATGSAERRELQTYIADCFARVYGASLYEFLPTFLAMDCCGKTSAAAGIKLASQGPLFLEQYFDSPVETRIALLAGIEPSRDSIAEIGNLVASHRGASQVFFLVMADILHRAGAEWIVFSATRQVAKLVGKLSCETLDLGPADPSRLGDKAANWGRYYDTAPRVLAIRLEEALASVRKDLRPSVVLHLYRNSSRRLGEELQKVLQR